MLAYSEGDSMLIVMELLKCSVKEYVDHQVLLALTHAFGAY
jgi:hypothetical protein